MLRPNPFSRFFFRSLSLALEDSIKRTQLDRHKFAYRFFEHWFRQNGSCFFFLFKKNLRVTNIQFGEQYALILANLTFLDQQEPPHLRFLSIPEFLASLRRITETFKVETRRERLFVAHSYAQEFGQTLVIDPLFGSCLVYLPPLLRLDLERICGESGYIHSCGVNLFSQFVYNTETDDLIKALHAFMPKRGDSKARVFTVYAREDWPSGEERQPQAVQDGIDQVKIPVNKFFMGRDRLETVLGKIRAAFEPKCLRIARPGRFETDHADAIQDPEVHRQKVIFLITDQEAGDDPRSPGPTSERRRFYICYEQHYKNENPFHLFDEDKPAWIDHTTIPHTLAGAMISITRPWWPKDQVRIADPFSGSGTIWFEAVKLPNAIAQCSDLSPAAEVMTKDNFNVFRASKERLHVWQRMLEDVAKLSREANVRQSETRGREFNLAVSACRKWQVAFTEDNYSAQERVLRGLRKDIDTRLLFYTILKTSKRHNVEIDTDVWWKFFKKELDNEVEGMRELADRKRRQPANGQTTTFIKTGHGKYSTSCYVDLSGVGLEPVVKRKPLDDFRAALGKKFDLIVTDPPYGFNTEEDPLGLAGLYRKMVPILLSALSNDAQLVIALPEWSHTGRQLPSYAYKEFLTHHILVVADSMNMEVVRSPIATHWAGSLFRAPFYWESERALRRAILHFRFRRRP